MSFFFLFSLCVCLSVYGGHTNLGLGAEHPHSPTNETLHIHHPLCSGTDSSVAHCSSSSPCITAMREERALIFTLIGVALMGVAFLIHLII